jgi:hypothetical protein
LEFIKEDPLYNWRTNDPAGLYINYTSKEPEPPKEFACTVVGHSGIVRPETVPVQTINLEFLGAGLFGPPREKTDRQPGWTGDAYKFGIYEHLPGYGRREIVILRTDGGGFYAYLDVSLEAASMWRHLCKTCSPEMLWNICSCVVHTHELARKKGRQEIMTIFGEGRLKKKRGRYGIEVYIKTKINPVATQPSGAISAP